jgi:hypothetical protein
MGKYKVWVDDYGIIRGAIFGKHSKKDALDIIREMDGHLQKEKGNGLILIDMTETGRPSSEARKIHAMNIKNGNTKFKRAAFFGATVMNRVLANFIIKASGRSDKVRYFDTQKEAIEWLKK